MDKDFHIYTDNIPNEEDTHQILSEADSAMILVLDIITKKMTRNCKIDEHEKNELLNFLSKWHGFTDSLAKDLSGYSTNKDPEPTVER